MAFTRAFLRGLSIDEDKIGAIMDAHVEVTDALKKQRDDYKADAEKYSDAQKEIDNLKNGEDWKTKYEDLKKDFDTYKTERENADNKAKKSAAYREILKNIGVGEKFLDSVLKIANVDSIEFDKDGNVKDSEKLSESMKKDWEDFIPKKTTTGADVPTPQTNTGGKMTREQIMSITDRAERREAIRNNPEAFSPRKDD